MRWNWTARLCGTDRARGYHRWLERAGHRLRQSERTVAEMKSSERTKGTLKSGEKHQFYAFPGLIPVSLHICGSATAPLVPFLELIWVGFCSLETKSLAQNIQSNLFFFFYFIFLLFRAVAYGGLQARGWIGVTAVGLHHSHSNTISEIRLRPTPQLMAKLDP